jgi:hypothetical protein
MTQATTAGVLASTAILTKIVCNTNHHNSLKYWQPQHGILVSTALNLVSGAYDTAWDYNQQGTKH